METDFAEILISSVKHVGVEISSDQAEKMALLKDFLLKENAKFNLTGIKDDLGVAVKHFADSLTLLRIPGIDRCDSFIDIGTGAGFPGLVLGIMKPDWRGCLIDSVSKKVGFVKEAAAMLGLVRISAMTGRAEEVARDPRHREKYSLAVTRGVASVSTSAEYSVPFLRKGGIFVAMKGPQIEDEIDDGKAALFATGAKMTGILKVSLPFEQGERSLLYAEKLSPTGARYPRKTGEPQKHPITRSTN